MLPQKVRLPVLVPIARAVDPPLAVARMPRIHEPLMDDPFHKLATEPFLKLWEQEVFKLLLAEGKITE